MNKWIGLGRLTKDPELRYTPNGVAVCRFTLAISRGYSKKGNNPEVDFIPVIVWQKTGEACAEYLNKGSMVLVEGSLQIRYYEDKDNIKKQATEVNAIPGGVKFLETRKKKKPAEEETSAPEDKQKSDSIGKTDLSGMDLNDLPF